MLEDQSEGKMRWGGGQGRLRLTSERGARSEWQQKSPFPFRKTLETEVVTY